jgi:FkbM family methyltransferase
VLKRIRGDVACAEIDVVVGNDTVRIARRSILPSELGIAPTRFVLPFELSAAGRLQFRVAVTGAVPLLVAENRPITKLENVGVDPETALDAVRFPDPAAPDAPAFLKEHQATLRQLSDHGILVRVVNGEVVLSVDGFSFLGRVPDDIFFVGEIFLENTYNLDMPDDTCVIDVGMNSGLVTLSMARRDAVKEVHSFEPFPETMARARANIAINPAIAGKISTYQVGLSNADEDRTFMVADATNSGAATIRETGSGIPVPLSIRDTAGMVAPIIDAALAKGRRIVMKIDCEGSEFEIFDSLERARLLDKVSVFMIEWHRIYDGKSQLTLMDPLLRRGFVTIDRSPRTGNGFFYAVRAA